MLVDYRCTGCGGRREHWVASPPPSTHDCPTCGGEARRTWSPIGLGGRNRLPSQTASPAPGVQQPAPCQQYPQIPGICHMTPSAQRRMISAYTRDGRARDAELGRQQAAADERQPTMSDAISHFHQPVSAGGGACTESVARQNGTTA